MLKVIVIIILLNCDKIYYSNGQISDLEIDTNGYILYCPCMGRFGNQADHFLGSLAFAHGVNRTLVLPPWIEYRKGEAKSIQVPFDRYFNVKHLEKYHRVLTMEQFMSDVAPIIWPADKRISFCYTNRQSLYGDNSVSSCNAKDGNPFGPFWDTFNVDFIDSEYYSPLNYDIYYGGMIDKWHQKYPADKWPVIAFTGAPATFPVQMENIKLHKYLIWSDALIAEAKQFIANSIPKGAFIGIHLRNGMDWVRACNHIKDSPNLFASAQCLGYRNERGNATMDMCMPNKDLIIRQLKRAVKLFRETYKDNALRSIFVASDNNHMINELNDALQRMKIRVIKLNTSNPHLDLVILGLSNHFIGNCISSYSAFVKRERDARGFGSTFWAFPIENSQKSRRNLHEEL